MALVNFAILPAALTVCMAVAALGQAAEPRVERVSFASNVPVVPREKSLPTIGAALYLPAGTPPFAAVVITPSSGGEKDEREHFYAREFARAGIAGLVVESFKSRGLVSSVRDQSLLTVWQTENDAVGALRFLVADGRFMPDRIGITGVSKGGTTALNTALVVRRRWAGVGGLAFAAHAPIAPSCTVAHRTLTTTGRPIFFMLAEHDDQTPPAPCVNLAESIRASGNSNVTVRIYEGAHHAWETLGSQPSFNPVAQNYRRCRGLIEDDGTFVSSETGEKLPGSRVQRHFVRTCMTLGAHCCGGDADLKARAAKDLIDFFKRSGF